MTHEEVYQELARDRATVSRWWSYKLSAQRRQVMKRLKFPIKLWFEYTSPRRIRYLIFTHIFDRKMKSIMTGLIVPFRTKDGWTTYTTWLSHQHLIPPMVLLPHVWKRYAERCHVDAVGIDLIKHYYERNYTSRDSDDQRAVGRSVRWNGEEHLSCCVPEGVLLGHIHERIFVGRTFITYDMTCGRQREEFEGKRAAIMDSREQHERILTYYQTGLGF